MCIARSHHNIVRPIARYTPEPFAQRVSKPAIKRAGSRTANERGLRKDRGLECRRSGGCKFGRDRTDEVRAPRGNTSAEATSGISHSVSRSPSYASVYCKESTHSIAEPASASSWNEAQLPNVFNYQDLNDFATFNYFDHIERVAKAGKRYRWRDAWANGSVPHLSRRLLDRGRGTYGRIGPWTKVEWINRRDKRYQPTRWSIWGTPMANEVPVHHIINEPDQSPAPID